MVIAGDGSVTISGGLVVAGVDVIAAINALVKAVGVLEAQSQ
jgi:hypothetical protein